MTSFLVGIAIGAAIGMIVTWNACMRNERDWLRAEYRRLMEREQ